MFHARKMIMNLSPTCPARSSHVHVGKREIAVTFFSCPTMSLAHRYIRHYLKSSLKYVSNDRQSPNVTIMPGQQCIHTHNIVDRFSVTKWRGPKHDT